MDVAVVEPLIRTEAAADTSVWTVHGQDTLPKLFRQVVAQRGDNRDRGTSHDAAPPTPPGIRVRTTAVRRIKHWPAFPWKAVPDDRSELW
jgi:hypothetical protein